MSKFQTDLNKNLSSDNLNEIEEFVDAFHIYDYVLILLKYKFYIITLTFFAGLGSIFYTLSLPNVFTSEALLEVQSPDGTMSIAQDLGSSFGSLLGIGSMGGTNEANKVIAILYSRDFLEHLLQDPLLAPTLLATKSFDYENSEIIFNEKLYSLQQGWVVAPHFTKIYRSFRSTVRATLDPKTGFISLYATHISPVFTKDILAKIILEFNKRSKNQALEEADSSIAYLSNQLSKSSQSDVTLAISRLIQNQLKIKVLASTSENYLLDPIDDPYLPDIKSGPARAKIAILITLTLFILICVFFITLNFYKKKSN